MDDIFDLIQMINDQGLWINNLFQNDTGVWTANVRSKASNQKGQYFGNFAHAPSPTEALALVLHMSQGEFDAADYLGQVRTETANVKALFEEEEEEW